MVVIHQKTGRLANRLFTFSRFIANSIEYKYTLVNPTFDEYCEYFPSTRENNFGKHPITVKLPSNIPYNVFYPLSMVRKFIKPVTHNYEYISPSHGDHYDLNTPDFIHKASHKTVYAHGWYFNDRTNLSKHASIIHSFFKPDTNISNSIQTYLSSIRSSFDILIGVHIRRGDYKTWKSGRYFYHNETYHFMMKQLQSVFEQKGKTVAFILCSNESVSTNDFPELNCFIPNGNLIVDLYTLAECDFIIGPPSTYSMWASYYGKTPLKHIHHPHEQLHPEQFSALYEENLG